MRHIDEVLFDTGSRQLYTMNKQSFDAHSYKSKNVGSQIEGRSEGSFVIGQLGAERTDEVVFLKLDRLKWDDFNFTNVRAITTQGASRIGAKILDYGTITINGFRRKIFFSRIIVATVLTKTMNSSILHTFRAMSAPQ